MAIILGIGDYTISNNRDEVIKTFALGSCVGLVLYCSTARVAAMAHIALPDSSWDIKRSRQKPGYYADTAVHTLIDNLINQYNIKKHDMKVYLYGGSRAYGFKEGQVDKFNIGERNVETVKKLLDEYNLKYETQNTGGAVSRTIEIFVDTGKINMYTYDLNKFGQK